MGSTSSIGSFKGKSSRKALLEHNDSRSQQDDISERSTFSRGDRSSKLPRLCFHDNKKKMGNLLNPQPPQFIKARSSPASSDFNFKGDKSQNEVINLEESIGGGLHPNKTSDSVNLLSPLYDPAQKSSLKKRSLFDSSSAEKKRLSSKINSRTLELDSVPQSQLG